jgi:mRNA-binding protein PUF3
LVEQQAELTKELEPEIIRVIRDQNGNHVVQKIIELVPRKYTDFIMDALRGQVTGLASHTYGCRVIQRMLEHGTEADKADIMAELHSSIQILITDQYGNYVAQHVLQNGKPEDRAKIIDLVMSQLVTLSKHKFASNVVEKCIEYGSPEKRSLIREKLTTIGSDGTNPLQLMMRDQYGNYVIRKYMSQCRTSTRTNFQGRKIAGSAAWQRERHVRGGNQAAILQPEENRRIQAATSSRETPQPIGDWRSRPEQHHGRELNGPDASPNQRDQQPAEQQPIEHTR